MQLPARLSEHTIGYLSTLLVCKAVQAAGRLGGRVAGRIALHFHIQH